MAKAAAGTKKSKDAIAKAATQKKGATKVYTPPFRNGPREKSKKKPTMQSSSTGPPTTDSSPVSPNSASTSPLPPLSKNTKLLAPSPVSSSANASKTAPSAPSSPIASKPFSPPSQSLFPRRQLLLRLRKQPRRRRPPRLPKINDRCLLI